MADQLRVYFVIGEVSGDSLGVALLDAFADMKISVEALGIGGIKMQERGLNSLFDISQIAIMGISGVITRLPSLLKRVNQVADDIVKQNPDVVILIDSPEFAKQVAKRVKRKLPHIPVVKYVCPQVWAWRENRAVKMKAYIDHILAILPFEPELMKKLDGPQTTYVGHPLAKLAGIAKPRRKPRKTPTILLMPGSRSGEIARLLPVMEKTIKVLEARGTKANFILPGVAHLVDDLRAKTAKWPQNIKIVEGEADKISAIKSADMAISTSGTAILELAMYMVPCISVYKVDPALKAIRFIIKAWTAALPNLIADKIIVPERINEFAHPEYVARLAEGLLVEGNERNAQLDGFKLVHEKMKQSKDPASIAAETIVKLL